MDVDQHPRIYPWKNFKKKVLDITPDFSHMRRINKKYIIFIQLVKKIRVYFLDSLIDQLLYSRNTFSYKISWIGLDTDQISFSIKPRRISGDKGRISTSDLYYQLWLVFTYNRMKDYGVKPDKLIVVIRKFKFVTA